MPTAKYTFLDLAEEILRTVPKPLTFQEIWKIGKDNEFTSKLTITGKTPWQTLAARLFVDIRDNPSSRFVKVGKDPARFFLISRKNELTPEDLVATSNYATTPASKEISAGFHERKLHPLLAYFAFTNTSFNRGKQIYTKTIYHELSRHSALNEWIHPDMVGFYSPIDNWNDKLLEFNKSTEKSAIRLYSFEVKKQINRSNYRECFFQAVSNSSWANEAYLVTSFVQQQDDLLSELERLSASFGIGIIILDLEDIDSSRVLFPARLKDDLDWETMNKLCEQNTDFESFIDNVQHDYAGKKIHASEYDKILSDVEEYIKKINSNN